MTTTRVPTPPELDDAPELAVLAVLEHVLRVAETALLAVYPHLVGDDDPTDPPERIAALILDRAAHLRSAVATYTDRVTGDAGGSG
jgi:hypothetical protein